MSCPATEGPLKTWSAIGDDPRLFPLVDFSNGYLDWGRSEWGGSGNYLWRSPMT